MSAHSSNSLRVQWASYISRYCLVLVSGIALGFLGNWWGQLWIWIALIGLISVGLIMNVFGTRYYDEVRRAVGVSPFYGFKKFKANPEAKTDVEELNRLLSSSRPAALIFVGVMGLAVMLWLMIFKPF